MSKLNSLPPSLKKKKNAADHCSGQPLQRVWPQEETGHCARLTSTQHGRNSQLEAQRSWDFDRQKHFATVALWRSLGGVAVQRVCVCVRVAAVLTVCAPTCSTPPASRAAINKIQLQMDNGK